MNRVLVGCAFKPLPKAMRYRPGIVIGDARIDAARRYLETSDLSIKDIAARCGFDGSESLRRLFSQKLDIAPVEYRQRFRSSDMSKVA